MLRKYALIIDNMVREIVEVESLAGRYHPGLEFIDVTDQDQVVSDGMFFDRSNAIFVTPPPEPWFEWNSSTKQWVDGRAIADILASYEAAIEARLDQFAQSRGYRHGDRLASYKGSNNATWAAEADHFIGLRESTWTKFISISSDVTAGKRAMPTLDELLAELPVLTWDSNA